MAVGDDHSKVDHPSASVLPDLLCHVGQGTVSKGAPAEGADALEALSEGSPVAAGWAEHLHLVREVQATIAPAQGHLVQVEFILQLADELRYELLHMIEQAVCGGLHGHALRCIQHEVDVDGAVSLLWTVVVPVGGGDVGRDDFLLLSVEDSQEPPKQEHRKRTLEHLDSCHVP